MTYSELRREVIESAQRLYESTGQRWVQPRHPNVLVWVAPKERMTESKLWTPENQNKLYYEGIVLRTWKPFWQRTRETRKSDGEVYEREIWRESEFKFGDHVIFQHWAGYPVMTDGQFEKDFRLVREHDYDIMGGGKNCIDGILHYEERSTKDILIEMLTRDLARFTSGTEWTDTEFVQHLVTAMQNNFHVLAKGENKSVTMSGA